MRKLVMLVMASALCLTATAANGHAQTAMTAKPAKLMVAGDWSASYETPGGARTFHVVLAQDGDKLTGTVKREAGDSPLVGMVKGDSVTFSYSIMYNDNVLAISVAAKVDGDVMKGMVDFAGQQQEAFQAKKVAGPEKK